MLTILSALLGFAGPFIPELIRIFHRKQDNQHELAMMEMQAKFALQDHLYKMEEINIRADIAETTVIHQPTPSFGVQLLDAAKDWPKIVIIPVFYLFSFLDFVSGFVRPGVTYLMVGFYLFYKWSMFDIVKLDHAMWQSAVLSVWTENDWAVLLLVLSFYFGQRTVKAAFGGSASTGKAGGG